MGLSLFLLISNIMTFPFKKRRCGMASDKGPVALGGEEGWPLFTLLFGLQEIKKLSVLEQSRDFISVILRPPCEHGGRSMWQACRDVLWAWKVALPLSQQSRP